MTEAKRAQEGGGGGYARSEPGRAGESSREAGTA